MRLAVVIPCYNHARYVGAAIESVLGQTRPPDRFLVIDDGSKDDSVAVIRRYAKDGVECVAQENQGAHNTINRLVARAAEDCDAIAILNSDDLHEPARFERLLPVVESGPAVVCSALRMINDEGHPLREDAPRAKWLRAVYSARQAEDPDLAEWLGIANFPLSTSNILGRSAFLAAHPFRPYRFNHDYHFLATAAIRGELGYVDEPLLLYRAHDSNTIQTQPAPLIREMQRMHLDLYRDLAGELRGDEAMRRRFYAFERGSWNSISAFHGGIHQFLLAELIAGVGEERIMDLVSGLDLPEMGRFPNSELVSAQSGDTALVSASALGERILEFRAARASAKEEAAAYREVNRIRTELARSRWASLGRVLGQGRKWAKDDGKSAPEKLERLRAAVRDCPWLGLGRRAGWWRGNG